MGEYTGVDEFIEKMGIHFGLEIAEVDSLEELGISEEDFLEFLEEDFGISSMDYEIKEDICLFELHGIIFK